MVGPCNHRETLQEVRAVQAANDALTPAELSFIDTLKEVRAEDIRAFAGLGRASRRGDLRYAGMPSCRVPYNAGSGAVQ